MPVHALNHRNEYARLGRGPHRTMCLRRHPKTTFPFRRVCLPEEDRRWSTGDSAQVRCNETSRS
jgi:hypothetical protein